MRVAIIENNLVANAIEVEPTEIDGALLSAIDHARLLLPGAHVELLPDVAGIGWTWTAEGGFVAPAAPEVPVTPVPAVPISVSMRQAKRALLAAGLLDAADLAIAGIADDTARRAAQIDWTSATDVRRDWPLVAAIAQALGLTDQQIDQLFVAASQL